MSETQEEKREKFLKDMESTRKMVASWPEWKRNALGQVPRMPDFPPIRKEDTMKSEGLMQDHDGYPVSRDWEDMDCSAIRCVYNYMKKCTVPSVAGIGEDGRCVSFRTHEPVDDSRQDGVSLKEKLAKCFKIGD